MNFPLGAHAADGGVHFSVFSSVASQIELCLFDEGFGEKHRFVMAKQPENVWQIFIPGISAGAIYGYRVHGPWAPAEGHFCNPQKLLLDPYARLLARPLLWHQSLFPAAVAENSAGFAPLARVHLDAFDWQGDALPRVPYGKTVIYEAHVRGLTEKFPGLPDDVRGTYRALAQEPVIAHLQKLRITTVELLPVQVKSDDKFLVDKGLSNYWGYSTLNFFIPEPRYGSITDFKTMVRALHRAGIEVILDVVYNHSAEMGADGPLLSLRGFDNRAYYLFSDENGFIDHTGCGNTLNFAHPQTRRLALDSLRYWAKEMHVDGFRFDLAPALFRAGGDPDFAGDFARELLADPVLANLKLIAEPWDLGPNGYARDGFAAPFRVWNDRFRDNVRRFWRGDGAGIDLLREMIDERAVNFVACHDGFTLRDLVSYREKHNEANLEDNRDGARENFSDNYGNEGETERGDIREIRLRQAKNLLATLCFARGVPMLLAGDEIGHSQKGNNNAYCQDNALTHLRWQPAEADLTGFVRDCLAVRAGFPWQDAVYTSVASETAGAMGLNVTFASGAKLLLLMNASPTDTAVFKLSESALFRERVHTARAIRDEPCSGICIVPPRGFTLLEAIGTG